MVPGFVRLGLVAVLLQLVVIGGFYGYLRYRHPVDDPAARRRTVRLLVVGSSLVAGGQVAALGAVGSLRTHPLLSLRAALLVQEVGIAVALVGYLVVAAGVVIHGQAGNQ